MGLIYLADDDSLFAELVCSALIDCGHGAGWLANGADALAAVRRRRPDLLILDCEMPKLSGVMLLKLLRMSPEWRDRPVIMLTACIDERDEAQALFAGANVYLRKPLNVDELNTRVSEILRRTADSRRLDAIQRGKSGSQGPRVDSEVGPRLGRFR